MELYKEKYEQALERARQFHNKDLFAECNGRLVEYIFPELAESEDEKVRKTLLESFEYQIKESRPDKEWVCGVKLKEIVAWLEKQGEPQDKGEISDGYHTFNELYNYRMLYNASFFNLLPKEWVHKSKKHHNGEECFGGGWFIVMANLPTGQISNHYELKDWDLFHIQEKEVADEWDGHTPQEAAERLHKYLLEKQGEQKPMDKVEPKFRNGQWIIWQDKCYKVNYDGCGYELVDQNGLSTSLEYGTVDENAHLWDITRDAKDGDVLATEPIEGYPSSFVVIYKERGLDFFNSYCFIGLDGKFYKGENGHSTEEMYPATKEQRDFLFQKMKEAGYEWDADKKELKKIIDEKQIKKNLQDNSFRRMFEQNPAWSEEDELHIRELESLVKQVWATAERENDKDKIHKMSNLSFFLKTLKPQLKQEWSEEDEKMCQETIDWFEKKCFPYALESENPARESIKWLKSIKDRVQPHHKQEWSDADERRCQMLQKIICHSSASASLADKLSDWLNSLKERITKNIQ